LLVAGMPETHKQQRFYKEKTSIKGDYRVSYLAIFNIETMI
jgi:hypothetical protein